MAVQTWTAPTTASFTAGDPAAFLTALATLIGSDANWSVSASGSGYVELQPAAASIANDRILVYAGVVAVDSTIAASGATQATTDWLIAYGEGVGSSLATGSLATAPWASGAHTGFCVGSSNSVNHNRLYLITCAEGVFIGTYDDTSPDDASCMGAGILWTRFNGSTTTDEPIAFGSGRSVMTTAWAGALNQQAPIPGIAQASGATSSQISGLVGSTRYNQLGRANTLDATGTGGSQLPLARIFLEDENTNQWAGFMKQIYMGAEISSCGQAAGGTPVASYFSASYSDAEDTLWLGNA